MPRLPRIELAGGIHHVTARAPFGRVLFIDDQDRVRYLELLANEVEQREWQVLTYCEMTNHVHLLIRTPEANLGAGMKSMHERFATDLNRRHTQYGHVFGARFGSKLVRNDRHLHGCLRYIAHNPAKAGMCRSPTDWTWSAHRAILGIADPVACVDIEAALGFLGANVGSARLAYQQLVACSDEDLVRAGLASAVDDFGIPVAEAAKHLGVHVATAYRRLDAARRAGEAAPR
jgi:REP-associated tyrosine transposase